MSGVKTQWSFIIQSLADWTPKIGLSINFPINCEVLQSGFERQFIGLQLKTWVVIRPLPNLTSVPNHTINHTVKPACGLYTHTLKVRQLQYFKQSILWSPEGVEDFTRGLLGLGSELGWRFIKEREGAASGFSVIGSLVTPPTQTYQIAPSKPTIRRVGSDCEAGRCVTDSGFVFFEWVDNCAGRKPLTVIGSFKWISLQSLARLETSVFLRSMDTLDM